MMVASTHGVAAQAVPPANVRSNVNSWAIARRAGTRVGDRIRLLVFTSLYPNAAQPRHGVFVEERLRKLVDTGRVVATVVAPVPWFPFKGRMFGAYAKFAAVPVYEERYGMRILHPRYPVIPKLGMNIAPRLMERALLPALRKLMTYELEFDLLDAHYFYPDGVAAARLGAALGKPVVITARGSDVMWIPRHARPREQIQWAADRAAVIVTVSQALKDKLRTLGVHAEKIAVLRNGVDLYRFLPLDRGAIREGLGLRGTVWLTVGNLVELKGVHLAIAALAQVQDATLLIVGDGPERAHLQQLADRLEVATRVRFLGTVAHDGLATYYNAADALLHPSSREGMPNVVLEALACGTPVVAAPFAGVAELISAPEAGEIASERSAVGIAEAWRRLSNRAPERRATRQFAGQFGWDSVVAAQCDLYSRVAAEDVSGMREGTLS
jgi:glycosyltransferase involved in cell wall biosynthesis